ncbi:hypothetical protein ACIBG0_36895 [Nocardia sp. NPDC050630]|uniref:hypothetical protein n=1 Tax=Nocardia sp. NPDC050630 TaxID=3364321 RepID=UPI003787ACB2
MTHPSSGRYQATLTRLTGDDPESLVGTFEKPQVARAWLRSQIRAADESAIGPARYHVRITDSVNLRYVGSQLYSMTSSGPGLLAALGDDHGGSVFERFGDDRSFDPHEVFPQLINFYEQITAEFVRESDDTQLAAKRTVARGDVAVALEGILDADRAFAVARVDEVDLMPLARPAGRFVAVLERSTESQQFQLLREQRFDSPRHAREWLRVQCVMEPADAAPVRATIIHTKPDGTRTSQSSEPAAPNVVAAELAARVDYDGAYVTGIVGVDRTRLAEMVAEYQLAANDQPTFQLLDISVGEPGITRREMTQSRFSQLGTEIAHMLALPHLADQAEHWTPLLAAADKAKRAHPNALSSTLTVASSGFVGADLQIALDQHHDLNIVLHRPNTSSDGKAVIAARIEEVRERIGELLPHPTLTATDRIAVLDDMASAVNNPTDGYTPIFAMPSAAAIEMRAKELASAPYAQDMTVRGRDIDNLIRMYQLTRVVSAEAEAPLRNSLRANLSEQHRHLQTRVANHPDLTSGEKTVLKSMIVTMGHDPHVEIPTRRAEYVLAPMPEQQWGPIDPTTLDNHTVSFLDTRNPGRQLVVGTEAGQWVARSYVDYPGYPEWRIAEAATVFADAASMIQALQTGFIYWDNSGAQRNLNPATVPDSVRNRLGQVDALRRGQTATPEQPSATSPPKASPGPTSRQWKPDQRRNAMRHQQPTQRRNGLGH